MKKIFLIGLILFSTYTINAQKVAIIGSKSLETTGDGVAILALENLNAGEIYYFTENEYDNPTNKFVDINESVVKITISTTITKGNIIYFEETTPNVFAVTITAGTGTATVVHEASSGNFSFGSLGESLYVYTDTDADPSNGVTEIHSAFFPGSGLNPNTGGPMPTSQNPSSDYPNAIIIHNFPEYSYSIDPWFSFGVNRVEYNTSIADRTDVNKVKLENTANYVFGGNNQSLSTTKFTNFNLVTTNKVITVTRNTSQLNENSSSNFTYTFTANSAPSSSLVINFSINSGVTDAKATFGTDFTQSGATSMNTTSGTVTIAAGTTSKTITINPTGDSALEPDETIKLAITAGTGYDAGSPSTASVLIKNDDTLTVVPEVAISGVRNYVGTEDDISEFSFVMLKDVVAGKSYVFSSNTFDKNTQQFSDVSTRPSELKWTVPAGGITRGEVIVIKKTAPNTLIVTRNGTSTSTGTVIKLSPSKKFFISQYFGLFITHTDADDNPYNGITNIQSLVYAYDNSGTFGGNIPLSKDLSTLYLGITVIDGFANSSPNKLEYKPTLRPGTSIDQANFENPSNWLYAQPSGDLSPVQFNNIIISEGAVNPKATVTASATSIIEDSETVTYTFALNAVTTANTTINFSVAGSATFTSDYTVTGYNTFTASTGSIIILNGSSSAQLTITPVADTDLEIKEDIVLTIIGGAGYDGGSPSAQTVNITNDDADNSEVKLAIIGINHLSPSSMTLVAVNNILPNSTFYFLRNQFDKETLSFQSGGKYKFVTPNTCIAKGTVFTITGGLNGPLTVNCNGTSGAADCGTATIEGSGNVFDFLDIGTRYHVYQDSDNDQTNGITQIHSVFNTGGTYPAIHTGGVLTPEENPKSVYANAIVVDNFPNTAPNRTEFDPTKRSTDITPALLEDISNYIHGQVNAPLDATSFNKEVFGVIYVNASATPGGNGKTWATAYNNLQDALSNTSTCFDNEIWVATGTYKPHLSDQTIPFIISENTSIYGGFVGTETMLTERNWNTNPTILSGDLNNSDSANAGDSHTIIKVSGDTIILDGFIIEYGFADGDNFEDRYGAGILIRNDVDPQPDNTQITNCIFRNNHSPGNGGLSTGGGISLYGSNHKFTNCLFHNNSSKDQGGAISLRIATSLTITNCTFSKNDSNVGGALFIHTASASGTTEITNSIFSGNTATTNNKNIYNLKSSNTVNLSNSSLDANYPVIGSSGGLITNAGSNLINNNPTFKNTAANDFTLTIKSNIINLGNNAKNTELKDVAGNQRKTGTIDMGAYEYDAEISEWLGTTDSNWNDASNWTNGVPTITKSALLRGGIINNPTISIAVGIKDILIDNGVLLTIDSGKSLTINRDLIQNGSLLITSDATSNGSLIIGGKQTGSANVEYQRYVTTNWHLITSPVENQNINTFKNDVAISGNKYAIATYNNSVATNSYTYYTDNTGANDIDVAGSFAQGKGYSVKRTVAGTFNFSGMLRTDDVSVILTDNSGGVGNKWNFVGNPFTSFINLNNDADATNNFLTVNALKLDPTKVAVYMWNASTTSYDIFNHASGSAKYVAPGQGFFVEAVTGGETIVFTEEMQSHQTGNLFLKTVTNTSEINLTISDGTTSKSTTIKYINGTTTGLDLGYDAGVFSGDSASFNIFSHLVTDSSGVDYALQCLPDSNYNEMIIPIGIKANTATTITFSIESLNLPNEIMIYLEDKVKNTITRLDEINATYTFTTDEAVNGIGRFYVHTTSQTLNIDDIPLSKNLNIYKINKNTLRIVGLKNDKTNITLFDVLGKKVFTKIVTGNGINEIQLPTLKTGAYIIHIQSEQLLVNKKIILDR